MMNVSKIEIVPVRQAFRHEALNFSVWLEENIEALSDRIGLDLTVIEREKSVGSFTVDLFCEDQNGNTVIVENQLERTDHDHLGKLLTYLVNLEAKTAIWIATEVRQEHQRVIDWLNEITPTDMAFYFVKVEAIRIGESSFAPLFTPLSQPDEQTHEIGEQKKELAERHVLRQDFWTQLLERSKGLTRLTENRSPTRDHWLEVASGKSGIHYAYLILKDKGGVEVYIDVGDKDRNKAIFDALVEEREAIEQEFGSLLDWQRLNDKRASRIRTYFHDMGSLRESELWPSLQDTMIQAMIRLDKTFRRRIQHVAQ
jgi:hypothetical protein